MDPVYIYICINCEPFNTVNISVYLSIFKAAHKAISLRLDQKFNTNIINKIFL